MAIRIQLFDGSILEFPDNTPQEVIDRVAKQETLARQPAPQPRPVIEPPKKEGVMAAFGKGLESLLGSSRTAVGAFTGSPEEAALAALERQKQSPYADQVSLEKVSEAAKRGLLPAAGEVARQVPLAIAEQAPNILATLGSARLGAMAGAGLGSVVPGVGTVVGGIGGGILGAIAPSLLQQFGGNIQRQAQEQQERGQPIDISRTAAGLAAVPQAGLDVAATLIPLGRTFAGKVLGPQVEQLLKRGSVESAERLARESLPTVLGKGAAVSIATEVPTEVIQTMLERAQAGLPLTTPDALAEYGSVAYQAGLLAPIGAVGRVGERSAARDQALLPGQRPGESDVDFANRLSQEIQAMKEAGKPPAPGPILDTNNLYNLIAQPNGYGLVEKYKQRLLALPNQTPEIKQAIEAATFIQNRSVIEAQQRRTTKPAPEDLIQPKGPDAGETITPPSGAGVQVAGEPGAGAAATGPTTTEPAGVVPPVADVGQPAGGAEAAPAAVAPKIEALPGSETRLILPDGEKRLANWEVIEADSVSAALVEGRAQPRDRQRAASNAQVKSIANNPDFDRLSDTSQTMDYGAPTLTSDYVIVGGNGRFEGINLAYNTEAGQAYKQNLISNAQRLGLDPAQVSGMKKPVLIRKISGESAKPEDTRKLAIQSNIVAGLEMSDMERAALDSERMTSLNQLDITDTGDIPLTTKNMGTIRDALKGYTKEELSGMLAADGSLSQSGLRRVKNAVLYKAYGKTDTLSRLLESPDADLKNVGTALMRASGNMSRLMDGIKSNAIPADYDIISDLTGAVETLSALRASGTKVQDFINQSDMFGGGISNEAKTILTFLDQNLRSAKSITEFLNDYANAAVSAEGAGEGLFGEVQLPSKQETIERAAQRPEAERAAAKAQQTIFEQPAGAAVAEGAAKPEGAGRPAEGGEGAVTKKSLVEMRKRYEAGRAAPAPVETPPEPTALDKEIEEKIDQLGKVLKKIMNKFGLKDVALNLIEDMQAEGEYAQSVVRLALDAVNPVQALRHESIHALKELGFFTPQQWAALEKQAKSKWIDQYLKTKNINKEDLEEGQKSRYDAYMELYKGDMDAIIEEAIADAFGDFDVNKAPPGLMQAILTRLRNLFDAIKTAFGGEVTAEQVFRKVEKGALKAEAKAEAAPAKQSLREVPLSTRGLMEVQPIVAMQELGLKTDAVRKPGGIELFNDVRSIALALNQDTIRNKGKIAKTDTSLTSEKELARAMVDEIGYQLKATAGTGTGKGWYSDNYPKAVKKLGKLYPELETDPYARTVFSALVAITSNGEKVSLNVKNAIKLYEDIRMGKDPRDIGSRRKTALDNNIAVVLQLMQQYGPTGMRNELLREITVKDMNAILRSRGEKPDTSYLADTKVPAAALYFGPKLGAFFSNLEGAEGYLTMDMWWTRTVNRMRGQLESKATEASIKKFAAMMDKPNATRDEVVAATIPLRNKYEEFGWHTELEELVGRKEPAEDKDKPAWTARAKRQAGPAYEALLFEHRLEKMANTIYKNEYELLEELPFTPSDREFMYRTARRTQSLLKAEGVNLSLADIQAALWYYEKRLYQHLSGRKADDIGYDEAITQLAGEGTRPARPSVVFAGQPVSGAGAAGAGAAVAGVGAQPAKPKLSLRDKLGMYSELENKIEAGSNKAPAASWKAYINGLTQKGVKPEEIEWSGVKDWLDLQKGMVTKEELLNYLKQGGVRVEETVLGGREPWRERLDLLDNRGYRNLSAAEKEELEELRDRLDREGPTPAPENRQAKYSQYTLPGGENYREVLLTLPSESRGKHELAKQTWIKFQEQMREKYNGSFAWRRKATKEENAEADRLVAELDKAAYGIVDYKSGHWDQSNIIAHIRLNDRTDADGNKVLFVEEIQSDWGQEGKKKGFTAGLSSKEDAELDSLFEIPSWERTPSQRQRVEELNGKRLGGVPFAPFVTKTEGWLNLALKRIMVMAAEGGYDKVAFTTGKQNAERFSLDKTLSEIAYEPAGDGKYEITATDLQGRDVISEDEVGLDRIEELVGKEIAEKIARDEGERFDEGGYREWRYLRGDNLKVEAKGMRAFYDTIVPTALKKLLPKVGGGQMRGVSFPDAAAVRDGSREKLPEQEVGNQPGFDVTDAMREKVQTTGLPRFSLRVNIPPSARARVVATTVTRQEKGFVERLMEAISPSTYSDFRAQALNRYNQLGVYDKIRAKKMGGAALLADSSAESAALLSDLGAGLTASALGVHDRMGGIPVFRNGITIISNQNGTIKGPTAIFAPLASDPAHYQNYQFWAAVKRGSRYMQNPQGNYEEKLFTPSDVKEAEAIRKAYLKEGVDFEAIQKEWIKYNDGLVQYMVDTGVLSKERADIYRKHADYLPFYRQMDGRETVGPKVFQAISGVKPPKAAKGSEAPLDDFLENIVRNTQAAIQAGVKNVAAQRAAKVAMDIGMARPLGYKSSDPLTFEVLENGKAVTYISQDILFVNAIKSLGIPDLPFIGLLSGPANLLRNLVTKDPGFMLANLMRDSMSAWVTSGVKMTPVVNTITNFGAAIAGKDPAFQALMNAGILGGYEFSQNVEQSGREFGKALRKQAGIKSTGIKGVVEMGTKPFTSLWDALEKGTTASDAATRMEVYKRTLAETGNEAEALFKALEVMNFNRKGSSAVVRILTAAVPFLNARMQGLDVLYRAASGQMNAQDAAEIQKRFFVRGATIAALSAAYWLLTHDDEEYKKQEQETRDNYWLLPSLGVKIPIPFEIGVLFKVIPERILGYTFGSDTGEDFLKSMARQLTSTLAVGLPQVAAPLIETATNFSFFTMRPIVGQGMEGLQPAYQVGPGTTRLAEGLGEMTKGMAKELQVSPMKIDQLISGYTGTMGMYLMNLMDAVYDMTTDSPKPARRFEQMPLIRRFALDPEARGNVTAYYELKNSIDSIVRTSNMLERTMNYEELPGYLMDNMKMLAAKDYILDLEKTMKEFREMKILIRSSKMDADAKKDAILSIDQMENQLTSNIQYMKKLAKGG